MNKEQQLQKTLDELSINKISSDHAQSIIEQLFKTDAPKMISVEAVKEKLNEMIRDYQDEGNSDNSNINNRVIGAIRACNKLLTFPNTHTNVK